MKGKDLKQFKQKVEDNTDQILQEVSGNIHEEEDTDGYTQEKASALQ
jgi:hypothetical protein